ncbi:hypothetical protein EV356DRAFT_503886 [Viridothelium virens]|uniref:Uncharacterized protein n=1 Tax=Viridothelium virens TaxID=1048519 RepID=A0A6A6H602_VIRVR|nr:hypothetical protein EV356DRAFT_503886 [Viridothelium virens]
MDEMTNSVQCSIHPDPTQEPQWYDVKGAIHEVFAANAIKRPNSFYLAETALPLLHDGNCPTPR